ncbi:vWA domain-containing protein [Microcella sp.]|uniref:vWA domain-containing protein n=1 Tax=Microcella sp. TaxID=1913979 RepID=UPI00255DCB4B|nr:vWA domain-containing protein [Microcella sp.]MBX9471961.1 VWA domain-containing protein [Microcella sp.]
MTATTWRRGRILHSVTAGTLLAVALAACVGPSVESPTVERSAPPPPVTDAPLNNEEAALQDLRGCLAVNNVLNVFYLLDDSGSLADTDRGELRRPVLADSLRSLLQLTSDDKVYWAAGSFKDVFTPLSDWSVLESPDDANRLAEVIPPTDGGWTNWEDGIRGASQSLAAQQQVAPGCSMLIWFTDGEINLGDGVNGDRTLAAFDALCTGVGGERGLLQQLRGRQVVVFGVFLNPNPDSAEQLVRVVEGSAEGGACAEISPTDVRGSVTKVTEAGDLADVFDRLSILVAGGSPSSISNDLNDAGEFVIPKGVSRFILRFPGNSTSWSLAMPSGELLARGDLSSPGGVTVTESSNSTSSAVEVSIDAAYEDDPALGTWKVVGHEEGSASLYLFSDLRVEVDRLGGGNLGVVSGEGAVITGAILDRDGNPANLSLYEYDWIIQERLEDEERPRALPNEISGGEGAQFTIDFGATSARPGAEPVVDISLVNLRTVDGAVALDGPIASLRLTVLDPDQVPADLSIRFGGPAGSAREPAHGEILANPPADGGVVDVIVRDAAPLAIQDEFGREFAIEEPSTACESGGSVCGQFGPDQNPVTFTFGIVEGEDPEFSVVRGELLVELQVPVDETSGQNVRVIQSVPFELQTERRINLGLLIGLLALLLLVGIAIPVALAWLLKRGLVGLQHGRLLQRAEFPVVIKDGTVTMPEIDLSDEASLASAFRNLPPNERVRTHTDARLGAFAVRVPLSPLQPAWFSLIAPAGTRLIAKQGGVAPRHLSPKLAEGTLVAGNGVLSSAWGVAIDERELRSRGADGAVAGVLVVYLQPVLGQSGQYAKRLLEIMTLTDWRARVRELAQAIASSQPESAEGPPSVSTNPEEPRSSSRPSSGGDAAPEPTSGPPRPPGRSAPSSPAAPTRSESLPPRTRGNDSPPSMPRPPGR